MVFLAYIIFHVIIKIKKCKIVEDVAQRVYRAPSNHTLPAFLRQLSSHFIYIYNDSLQLTYNNLCRGL